MCFTEGRTRFRQWDATVALMLYRIWSGKVAIRLITGWSGFEARGKADGWFAFRGVTPKPPSNPNPKACYTFRQWGTLLPLSPLGAGEPRLKLG